MVLCSCSFMPLPTIPKACLQHLVHGLSLWLLSLALSLCALLHSSAICLYLPSWCICLSLSEVWETGVRGLCQTNQQHSLTAIPLCIWLCIWMCTVLSASTTTDRVSQDVHTHTHTFTHRAFTTAGGHVMYNIKHKSKRSKQTCCLVVWWWKNTYATPWPRLTHVVMRHLTK